MSYAMYRHDIHVASVVFPEIAEMERAMLDAGMVAPTSVWFGRAVEKVYRQRRRTRLRIERQLRIRDRRAKRQGR